MEGGGGYEGYRPVGQGDPATPRWAEFMQHCLRLLSLDSKFMLSPGITRRLSSSVKSFEVGRQQRH